MRNLTKAQQQTLTDEAVQHLCSFINQYQPEDQHQYSPSDFSNETDYAYTKIDSCTVADEYNCNHVIVVSLHDGDEGGPSMLIITTDGIVSDPAHPTINCIVHYFDTTPTIIYTEGHVVTDEERR